MPVDHGLALQEMWQAVQSAPTPAARAQAAVNYAYSMLQTQANFGTPRGSLQLLGSSQAAGLAAMIANAPPEQRAGALANVAAIVNAMPGQVRLADGSFVSPKSIIQQQLLAANVSQRDMAAIVDAGGDAAALNYHALVSGDPLSAKPLPGKEEAQARALVIAGLQPEMRASQGIVNADVMNGGRVDNIMADVRHQVAQGVNLQSAVNAAVGRVTSQYIYTPQGFAIPKAVANSPGAVTRAPGSGAFIQRDAIGAIKNGQALMLQGLTANAGANIGPVAGMPGSVAAALIQRTAVWKNTADGQGLALLLPKPGGAFEPVIDRWGRPVTATWGQLKTMGAPHAPDPFAPPAHVPTASNGQPVPAASRQTAFNALVAGQEYAESRGVNGLTSPAGALGLRQVEPATAAAYAMKLFGQPLDAERLRTDPAYNRAIGNAYTADLINHYGSTPGGILLAATAYHQGTGNVEGYNAGGVHHPGLIARLGDPRQPGTDFNAWINRLPPQARAYVPIVLDHAFRHLQGGG